MAGADEANITKDVEYREICRDLHKVATRLFVYRARWREKHKKDPKENPTSLGMFDMWQELIVYCLVVGQRLGGSNAGLASSMVDMMKHCLQEHLGIPMGVDDDKPEVKSELPPDYDATVGIEVEGKPDAVVGFGPGDCIACAITKSFKAAVGNVPVDQLIAHAVVAALISSHAVGTEDLLGGLCDDHGNWEHRRHVMAPGGQA